VFFYRKRGCKYTAQIELTNTFDLFFQKKSHAAIPQHLEKALAEIPFLIAAYS
jgi:hypothetical protein